MNFILWLFLPFGLLLLAGFGLSFYLTIRRPQIEFHTPSEYGLAFEEVTIRASDSLVLSAWWIPAPGSERAVVILHGHGGSKEGDVHRAPALHTAGFNVLLFDFRAHGHSQGHVASFGYLERRDVQGVVEFIKSKGIRRIGLLGFSYGGIAAMLSAPICPEVKAIVTDGGPARMRTAMAARGMEWGHPRWLAVFMAWWVLVLTSIRLGANQFRYEPVRWVGKLAPRPVFFIHGELDRYCSDFDDLYAAAGEPKEVWRLPGVDHTKASETYPEEFRRRVVAFFDRYL